MCDYNYEPPEVDMTEEEYEEYLREKDMEDIWPPEMLESFEEYLRREEEEMEQESVKDEPSTSSPENSEKSSIENKDSSETCESGFNFPEDIPF